MHNGRCFDIIWVLLSGIDRADIEHVECWKEDIVDLQSGQICTLSAMEEMFGFENSQQ